MKLAPVWEDLSRTLRSSPPYRALLAGGDRVGRLPLAGAAWVFGLLARDLGRALLVLVPHEADALAWLEAAVLVGSDVVYFPTPSLTPYQSTEASLPVRAHEAAAFDRLLAGGVEVVLATPRALFRRLPEPAAFGRAVRTLAAGEEQPIAELVAHLTSWGYHRTDLVTEVGELAVRGGVFDFFPPGEELPLRLDLFGDTIETIRRFDPVSQRSEERVASVRVLPLSLFAVGPAAAATLADRLQGPGADHGIAAAQQLEALRRQGGFPGWRNLLPLAAAESRCLPDLLPDARIVAVDPAALDREAEHHERLLAADCEAARSEGRLAPPPEAVEEPLARVAEVVAASAVRVGELFGSAAGGVDFAGSLTDRFEGQLPRFPREVETARARGERLLLVAPVEQWRRLEELCRTLEVPLGRGGVELVAGELERGFRLPPAGVVVYGERQLLPRLLGDRPRRRSRLGPFVSGLRDLRVGDFVVHDAHGIGQFVALRSVGSDGRPAASLPPILAGSVPEAEESVEVMEIAYAGGRRLLMPLSRLDEIQKYSGIEGVAPRLDQLGGSSWSRTKERVRKGLRQMAGDLLKLYAERQLAKAPAIARDSDLLAQFEAAFEFEETPDQLEAIAAIKHDLEQEQPMDRLLCGDVGYGKTEVAMRAAFKVADGGFQVAVLAPTTILADQHLETFRRRFAGFPVRVDMVSRFRSPAEVREVRRRVAAGEVDILIGTHRLLSRDVEIPRLALLVIDEEQRFGVAQKERLKQLRKEVHVLAMSATPVPRTLQLSLAGVRDLSVIETPPKDRMAVETAIAPMRPEIVREAIEFELERGGQIYYVDNRVEGIEERARELRELVPGLRVTVGHGQMDEIELARRMHAFREGEHDLLLATTIIENGIDIANVNTMLVHRADRFGLAQLYQLRGRVGRSNQLAYCYLLVAADRVPSENARKRLAALREFSDLGAGFRIAARDLEIRGAGNLLGAEQSGHIGAVGMETYLKMLEEAVRELRGEVVEEAPATSIDLPVPLTIPQDYIADANLRMEIYRKIAAGADGRDEIVAELTDRFGPPPPAVGHLLAAAALKRLAESLRVQSITARGGDLQIRLRRDARVDVEQLIELVSETPGASFSPTGVLTLTAPPREGMLTAAHEILAGLRQEAPVG